MLADEMDGHFGYDKHAPEGMDNGISRNSKSNK
jgi:hypothetical protein